MKTPETIENVFSRKNLGDYFSDYNPMRSKSKKLFDEYNPMKKRRKLMSGTGGNGLYEWITGGAVLLALSGVAYALYRNQKRNHLYQKNFNPSTVFKFQGKIIDILHTDDGNEEADGVELLLQTSDSVLPVHLGPAWYLDHQQVKFRKGEKINITGSMDLSGNEASVVASTVQRGNKKLNLRDPQGHPYWYAWSN